MAGGSGKRLWPISRKNHPKQFAKLFDGKSLIQKCYERMVTGFKPENIFVMTNKKHLSLVKEQLTDLPTENIIAEPVVRDTLGAIALSAIAIEKKCPNANIAIVSSDHIISPSDIFVQTIKNGLKFVDDNPKTLMTFGIKPAFASTQFGYLKCEGDLKNSAQKVLEFKEKPNEATAKQYISQKCYLWNAGIFAWKAQTILKNIACFVEDATGPINKITSLWLDENRSSMLEKYFPQLPKLSIDYAVMEKSDDVFCMELDCDWMDLGSFNALSDILQSNENGNVVIGQNHQLLNCENTIVIDQQKGHLIAAIGLSDMIVAHTKDATIVCPKNQSEKLKELLVKIEKQSGEKFL